MFSYPFFFSCLFATFIEVIDRFFIDYYAGSAQTGIYYLGYRFGYIMSFFVISFRNSWIPHYFNVAGKMENGREEYIGKIFTKLIFIFCLVLVAVMLFINNILNINFNGVHLLSKEYLPGIKVLPYILVAYAFNGLVAFYSIYPNVSGKSFHFLIDDGLGFVVNVVLNVLLIPRYGIMGAALATTISYLCSAIYLLIISYDKVKVTYRYKEIFLLILLTVVVLTVSNKVNIFAVSAGLLICFLFLSKVILNVNIKNLIKV
jgi:O-antigen/teichoic acid export membrane protein